MFEINSYLVKPQKMYEKELNRLNITDFDGDYTKYMDVFFVDINDREGIRSLGYEPSTKWFTTAVSLKDKDKNIISANLWDWNLWFPLVRVVGMFIESGEAKLEYTSRTTLALLRGSDDKSIRILIQHDQNEIKYTDYLFPKKRFLEALFIGGKYYFNRMYTYGFYLDRRQRINEFLEDLQEKIQIFEE
ncbi:MAG: hypothetical protein K0R28_4568 [Paenibacillus sp.]|jgi:hypothetical protein|nr:hypothetical protein [Paenibacillus sp.]